MLSNPKRKDNAVKNESLKAPKILRDEWGDIWRLVPWAGNDAPKFKTWVCYKGSYAGRSITIFKDTKLPFWSYVAHGSHLGYLLNAITPEQAIRQLKHEKSLY